MTEMSGELVERMAALMRDLALDPGPHFYGRDALRYIDRAKTIAAELPEQADPDLIEARSISHRVLIHLGASAEQIAAGEIIEGERDDAIVMHVALEAIKRGRELQSALLERARKDGDHE